MIQESSNSLCTKHANIFHHDITMTFLIAHAMLNTRYTLLNVIVGTAKIIQ